MDPNGHLPAAARWLHIQVSMASFVVVFFFGLTGLTLNHAGWFAGGERKTQYRSTVDPEWTSAADGTGDEKDVARLEIVEHLRKAHSVRGEVSHFRVDETRVLVAFKAPGYSADAVLDRKTGTYELTVSRKGLAALANDLHTGRDSGPMWKLVIDLAATLLTLGSLTGLVLASVLHQHRLAGLVSLVAGGAIVCLLIAIWVP
jgi:uncharacterized protein